MENQKSKFRRYNSLIWLLLTEYENNEYTPSKFVLDTLGPKIDSSRDGLHLEVLDSTLYDFKITKGFKEYIDDLYDTSQRFDTSLLILSFTKEKYISRDYYLANLAKLYTCSDIAYVNCPVPDKITSKVFDYVIPPEGLPDQLKKVIEQ